MHPNFVVGSSAERVFVYEDQESLIISVVIYTIVCAMATTPSRQFLKFTKFTISTSGFFG